MRSLLAFLPLLLAASASAQSVAGFLSEEGTGQPIDGAVIVLVDEAGAQRTGTLTDERGHFLLHAPAPGGYRMRAERIGFRSSLSPSFRLEEGGALRHDLVASTDAIVLGGVEVEGERRCVIRPAEGMRAATLWEEARKALSAAALTEDRGLARFRVRTFERRLDPQSLRAQETASRLSTHLGSRPFASPSAGTLAREGYVRPDGDGSVYYAPDAHVLLSDAFLDSHCFRVRRGEGDTDGMMGLAFEPLPSQTHPDIEGVVWLDARTAELRRVEFDYTRLPSYRDGSRGGRVEYERLAGGAWIVRRWWIRMPVLGRDPTTNRIALIAVKEAGGEATEVTDAPPEVPPDRAVLRGLVYDSVAAAPLAGATVFLSGTAYTTTTDEAGSFRLESPLDGVRTVGLLHPRLDSLGVSPTRTVTLVRGTASTVELAIPATRELLVRSCAAHAPAGTGLVVGTVFDDAMRATLPGAQVLLTWKDPVSGDVRLHALPADAEGGFHFCGVPREVPVRARALLLERSGPERELRMRRDDDATRVDLTFRLSTRPSDDANHPPAFGRGVAAALRGRVLDAAGAAVDGAVVRLGGTALRKTTGPGGGFEMRGIPADGYLLTVVPPSGPSLRQAVELTPGENHVELVLPVPPG